MKLKALSTRLPLHEKHKLMSVPLFPDLRREYQTRSLPVRRGDTVLIRKGAFKGHEGKVTDVDVKRMRIYVEGVTRERSDGTTVRIPIRPWDVVITRLDLSDKWRRKALERRKKAEGE